MFINKAYLSSFEVTNESSIYIQQIAKADFKAGTERYILYLAVITSDQVNQILFYQRTLYTFTNFFMSVLGLYIRTSSSRRASLLVALT